MNKYTIITIIAIIIIVAPFANSGLSLIGVQQLEYRWGGPGEFSFFKLLNHGNMEICNAIPFWISFQKFEIGTFYEGKHIGTFAVNPTTLNPSSSTIQEGIFTSEEIAAAQHIFMTLDFQFDGGDIRLDPNQFIIVTNIDTSIIGIIPISTTSQISGFEFDQNMKEDDLTCD